MPGPPNTIGSPFGYVNPLGNTARVVYVGTDNHVHELRSPPGQGWFDADLSALAVAQAVASGVPSGYVTPDNTARVTYRGGDEHIHELRLPPGQGWFDADLSALAKGPVASATDPSNPFGYVSPDKTARVVYARADDHIHELSLPQEGSWSDADLSSAESFVAPHVGHASRTGQRRVCVDTSGKPTTQAIFLPSVLIHTVTTRKEAQ